jgi:hypothetical protein
MPAGRFPGCSIKPTDEIISNIAKRYYVSLMKLLAAEQRGINMGTNYSLVASDGGWVHSNEHGHPFARRTENVNKKAGQVNPKLFLILYDGNDINRKRFDLGR